MAHLAVYLDVAESGRVMAHLLEPPGLGMRFPSRAAMEADLPAALDAHLAWLRRHGEAVPPPMPLSLAIMEEIPMAGDFESGDDVGFYEPDAMPVTPAQRDRYLRIGGYAHDDLRALVAGLDDDVLDWIRDDRTRPIRGIVRHVVGAELWYMTRLIDDPQLHGMPEPLRGADGRIDTTEDVRERLDIVWDAFRRFARSLSPEQLERVATPSWFADHPAERWSARKMLRRCIEHCREHTRNVEAILQAYRAAHTPG